MTDILFIPIILLAVAVMTYNNHKRIDELEETLEELQKRIDELS